MTRSERYTCTISRDADGRIISVEVAVADIDGATRSVRLNGHRAPHVAGSLQEVLRTAGLRGRHWTSPTPIELQPNLGAHAELLLRAVKPLRRIDRIAEIAEGVAAMSREEAGYWHAQVRRRRGLKALRILLDVGRR